MKLKEKLLSDLKGAMKSREILRLNTLRSLTSEIKNREIDQKGELEDEELVSIIKSQIKKRKEAIDLYRKGGREDLLEKEQKELEILETYLPEQVSEEELQKRVKEVLEEIDAKSPSDLGKAMKVLVPEFKGRADNQIIRDLVLKQLNR